MTRPRSALDEAWRLPAPIRVETRPGEVRWRLRKLHGERSEHAIARAKRMWWWQLLRSKQPAWSAGWWYWPGKPGQRPPSGAGARVGRP